MNITSLASKASVNNVVPLTYHLFPLAGILLYVFYPKSLRINEMLLHRFSVIHNSFLVAFSLWTFVSLSMILYENGVVFSKTYYFQDDYFDFVIYLFYLSKYYEFFDTFLLYLQGKKPIFLQKFHHIGAVIVWHLCYVYKVDAIWIPSFANSFVHTVMYFYYLGCILRINQVRFIKQYITTLQLVQLFIPNFIVTWYYYPPVETWFNYNIILIFVGYVSVLVYLFSHFYITNYIEKSKKLDDNSHCKIVDVENVDELKED